jgi:hypothetical protein
MLVVEIDHVRLLDKDNQDPVVPEVNDPAETVTLTS